MVEIYPRPIIEHYLTSYSSKDRERKVFMKSYLNFEILAANLYLLFTRFLSLFMDFKLDRYEYLPGMTPTLILLCNYRKGI